MKPLKSMIKNILGMCALTICSMQSAYGEDTEIFFAPAGSTDTVIPNVVFVIDTSGSMLEKPSGSSETRIKIVKDVMDDVLTNINNVNVGLMRYNKGDTDGANSAEGGPVLFPATYIDKPADPTVSKLISIGENDGSENSTGSVTLSAEQLNLGNGTGEYVALRFPELLIPQGAVITSANLVFAANGDSSGASALKISAQLIGDASELKSTSKNISLRDVTSTTEVSWAPGSWESGNTYSSDDIASVVQQVVNLPTWCGGNSMAFLIKGEGARKAHSLEGSVANSTESNFYPAPKLHLKFKNELPTGATGCIGIEVNSQVSHRGHDWERGTDGRSWWDSGDIDFYYGNNGYRIDGSGVTFASVNIPKNAKIKAAYLKFTPYANENGNGRIDIKGVKNGNPDPTDYNSLYNKATLGPVRWDLGRWRTNQEETSPDISGIVQDIVNEPNWQLGKAMAFYIEGKSGEHIARAYDNSASRAPKLYVLYEGVYQPGVVTKREELKTAVSELPADGYTPISDVMAEAGYYYRGGPVTYGIDRDNQRVNRTSHPDSWENTGTLITPNGCTQDNYSSSNCAEEKIDGNPNYISPIEQSCQTNHIVFLTDGYPTSHHARTNAAYNAWSGGTCSSYNYGSDCAIKIAGFLNNNDQAPNVTGKQSVTTHTIGFDIDFKMLEDMAAAGGGSYYTASNKDGLIKAITNIVGSIADVNTTFVSSGVSVNQLNRLTHNDELYFALFKPAGGNVWPGNLKKFKLKGGKIVDKDSEPAVDSGNGQFKNDSWSWWSSSTDGNDVQKGGAAEKLGTSRKVYSNLSGANLTSTANAVKDSNSIITKELLEASSDDDRTLILKWVQGIDVDGLPTVKAHNVIGDPLHSKPTLVIYNTGSEANPDYDTKVFLGTNHGFLHSFNSEDGTENWSFIPKGLLKGLSDIQKASGDTHEYGIDGTIFVYHDDPNENGVVDSGEKAYLYVGMRRGGNTYYALDISDPVKPTFKFKIDSQTSGFANLGDTWSTPIVGKMNIGNETNKLVMIFGGGYDEIQDTAGTEPQASRSGKVVYIADAITGGYLWDSSKATQAGQSEGLISDMESVPSTVSVIDFDADGLIDNFYVSDTKAQIFRFDVDKDTGNIVGGKIASLQSAADIQNNRRFYYQPDVALIRTKEETFVSVSIGSGYRAHPLDKNIQDYFYMIKDKGILTKKFDMNVTMSDLADITGLVDDSDSDGTSDAAELINTTNAKGWYLKMRTSGEKVIERSITFGNIVLFTSYVPPGNSKVCEAASGSSRFYALKITDGTPYKDRNYDDKVDADDYYTEISAPGISPPPTIIIPPDQLDPVVCTGTECVSGLIKIPDSMMGTRWRKND